jgi:cell division protein FtsB
MGPDTLAVFIPIVSIGGFFTFLIVRTISKAYTAKLQAGSQGGAGSEARQEELAATVEELRREVAELAERVDFTERLLAKQSDGQKLAPPR